MDDFTGEAPGHPTPGALYILGTPIGNLEDITLRALRILKEADLIAAEDTRVTRKLLHHFEIHTPLTSYHQHSHGSKARSLADRIEGGEKIALVSDAGMPGVSDPGWELIDLCIERNLTVIPIPGPTAVITALAAAGLSSQRFAFDGFPPRQRKNRVAFFSRLKDEPRTVILYESPRRLRETLDDLVTVLGPERRIVVARELTKLYEEFIRGRMEEVISHFEGVTPRGEFVIVIEGAPTEKRPTASDFSLQDLGELESPETVSTKDLAARLESEGFSRREAYRTALMWKKGGEEEREDNPPD